MSDITKQTLMDAPVEELVVMIQAYNEKLNSSIERKFRQVDELTKILDNMITSAEAYYYAGDYVQIPKDVFNDAVIRRLNLE